ncbi:aminopeptidase [Accumulibacter sp.]|uniref:aminopeptidase n=1 Tax=Accumulibacter sp. TaxID=2053492 RepID=UPI0025D750B4|nr:aminopeptidase [Accumulibacter sp.]MCM8594091.1 aminopeptidase [Accumulibacter sp.]MCM8624500.1 aminopeptidase [Accumulibacter sp.]MDS4048235.1 aminopeptidase [Accumulibacter sp.]
MSGRVERCSLALLVAALLAGCGNLGYYTQAIGGHLTVMRSAVPIEVVLADPASDPRLRQRLEEVLAIRDFASRELALPDNGSYRSYADIGRPYVVWNVFAAPEFSLEPRRWCLWIVGCVSYRGYYDHQAAERLAEGLRDQGDDTFVGGVAAYSTLGHFADPVLSSFLRLGTVEVAGVVFHELAHQVVYVAGDPVFSESFATVVGDEGLRRWIEKNGTPAEQAAVARRRARETALARLVGDYRSMLETLYAEPLPIDAKREAKARLFAGLRNDAAGLGAGPSDGTAAGPVFARVPNNATLASLALYGDLVPAFEALLAEQQHDLPQFYARVRELAALPAEARHAALASLLPGATERSAATSGAAHASKAASR